MYQQPCHISSAWWPWSPAQMGCLGPAFHRVDFCEGVWWNPTFKRYSWCLFHAACLALLSRHNFPASLWTCSLPLTSKFSRLIRLARWKRSERLGEGKVFWDSLLSLGFCLIDSMFGEVLSILIFHLAAIVLPHFPASPLFLIVLSSAAFHHQVFFCHQCFLADPHTSQLPSTKWNSAFPRYLFCPTTTSIAWGRLFVCFTNHCSQNPQNIPISRMMKHGMNKLYDVSFSFRSTCER